MLRVLHVTPGLESGGAEMMLTKLVGAMNRASFENVVISLTDEGPILGSKIRQQSVPLQTLDFPRGAPNPMLIHKLSSEIRRLKPSIVQTWMYHANVVGALACALAGHRRLVWGIHAAKIDPDNMKRRTAQTVYLGKRMSRRFPTRIVCCSDASRVAHAELGYFASKLLTINNGIDTDEFVGVPSEREAMRREWGIPVDAPVVGLVARYAKFKDHATFFRAAGLLHRRRPETHFVLYGGEITRDNPALRSLVDEAGVRNVTLLQGLSDSIARVNNGFDVATSSSAFSESFCIALGEAMACGVPCVTTNLEGPAELVGDTGKVVPVGDAEAMATAWEEMIDHSPVARADIAERARRRIVDRFSLGASVNQYEELYQSLSEGVF